MNIEDRVLEAFGVMEEDDSYAVTESYYDSVPDEEDEVATEGVGLMVAAGIIGAVGGSVLGKYLGSQIDTKNESVGHYDFNLNGYSQKDIKIGCYVGKNLGEMEEKDRQKYAKLMSSSKFLNGVHNTFVTEYAKARKKTPEDVEAQVAKVKTRFKRARMCITYDTHEPMLSVQYCGYPVRYFPKSNKFNFVDIKMWTRKVD